ncbi:hypothetical protein [Desulfobacula sp.]|uniref:hypothetical protein n=1 Tax=Desulfobacula sp. TaxID=2593537 RepID=UPI0025C15295|nr:hypothetical protein [Desulfobacula sp.]MBC2704286.1 hypothetical protein [Desulfobacula sp.]
MKLVRIKANYTENEIEHFILSVLVDHENNLLTDTEMFGYVVDESEDVLDRYPFIITATTNKKTLMLDYGADSGYATSKINLPTKKIKVGEYFTRWEEGDEEEYTYIIEKIFEIIS